MSKERLVPAVTLGGLTLLSLGASIWLMRTDQSTTAFYMSPVRAWEFLLGALVAIPVLPPLPNLAARALARGGAIILFAIALLGLRREAPADPDAINLMQATQPACMPTLSTGEHGIAWCVQLARQMLDFFRDHHPNVVVISADWSEYLRRGFDLIIDDLKRSAALVEASGTRVVVLGPAVQFKGRLPAMLLRAHFRGVDVDSDDLMLPSIST